MATNADSPRASRGIDNQPNAARHAEFAGDATGQVAGQGTPALAPDKLPHHAPPANPPEHNPGLPANTHEDAGWIPEEQGSQLASEREGVPEGDVPHNVPDSATRSRSQT